MTDSEDFCCEGNIFADLKSLSLKANITPRQHKISERGGDLRKSGVVRAYDHHLGIPIELYKPFGLSLPNNGDFKSLLVSFSTRLTNRYLITRGVPCPLPHQPGSGTTHWYNATKPFVWHRNEDARSVVEGAVS